MKNNSLYFALVTTVIMLSGCASNKFNEYWETTSVTTTQVRDLSHNKPNDMVVKQVEEDRSVETFKVEMPEAQTSEEVNVEASLDEGEEILIVN